MIDRRQFMILCGASASLPYLQASVSNRQVLLGACSTLNDQHFVQAHLLNNNTLHLWFEHELPGRAHHIAVNADASLFMVVARRPGTWMLLGDLQSGEILHQIEVPEGRHLLGHGIFSSDGRHFYSTESDYQNQGDNGLVVQWDIVKEDGGISMDRALEMRSGGVGPHELLMMPDQQTLVVANGGIRTHPQSGREKLNIDTMRPSLVYLNTEDGDLSEQLFLDSQWHQASMRHLDVNDDGVVAIGMQYEGPAFENVPLLALHERGKPLEMLFAPQFEQVAMKQYVGSVRFSSTGKYFSASCPRGDLLTFWDAENKSYIGDVRARDACGLTSIDDGFIYTSGNGNAGYVDLTNGSFDVSPIDVSSERMQWDNHLVLVSI